MREANLPSPSIGSTGFHLRRVSAKAISQIQKTAPRYSTGKHPQADALLAFFNAAAAAVAPLVEA